LHNINISATSLQKSDAVKSDIDVFCYEIDFRSFTLHRTVLMYFIYLEGNHSIKFILSLNISLNTLVVYIDFQESSNYSPHVRPARNLSANF